MSVSLSVSVSCLLLSSSSHCVVSTSEKRGTKKVFHSCPKISPHLFRLSFPPRPRPPPFVCPPAWFPSLPGPVELLSPYQPNHSRVAAASRPLRIVSGPRLARAGGSPCGRHQGLPPVRWLKECASVSVYLLFSHLGQSDKEHINGGPI